MFRDSRGVVHTVSSPDPLEDLPPSAATALAGYLLVPVGGDLGGALERCEAVGVLLDSWQDAFFAALPPELDRAEEVRYASEAGVDLDDLDADYDDDWSEEDEDEDEDAEVHGQLDLDSLDMLEVVDPVLGYAADPLVASLEEDLVGRLERDLLLLPMRVRLEALMAASALVEQWSELLADNEKCLGHLILGHGHVLAHGHAPEALDHEALADVHAALHGGEAAHP